MRMGQEARVKATIQQKSLISGSGSLDPRTTATVRPHSTDTVRPHSTDTTGTRTATNTRTHRKASIGGRHTGTTAAAETSKDVIVKGRLGSATSQTIQCLPHSSSSSTLIYKTVHATNL